MSACSPQRFLPNNRNLFRTAALAASSVLPVANQVDPIKTARSGTARVSLAGTYTGDEQAEYEIEILDTDVELERVSTPTFSGKGSGTIGSITASGTQQVYTVECSDAGTETTTAQVDVEGVTLKALAAGADGNDIRITVDQSTLVRTPSTYSLLRDLRAGEDTFTDQGFDWGQPPLDGNGLIPASAPRVSFGVDGSSVHLAYREFVDGVTRYRIVPALDRNVPRGTVVYFVTGGRTVSVTNVPAGVDTETYTDIVTAYDLLYALRTESGLLIVDGVVANDRSPTGQASRELTLRTDAHAEPSYGEGSQYATGVENVTVNPAAGTQLVTLTCFAVNSGDHPSARLGKERWSLKSSLLGDLGVVVTGEAFSGAAFGLTVPVKHPDGYGAVKGRFGVTSIDYATTESQAPICPVALTLGPEAIDQTITLVYTTKPTGNCSCAGMPVPDLDTACLGNNDEGDGLMAYAQDTIDRLIAMRAWYRDLAYVWTETGSGDERPTFGDASAAEQADALAGPLDNYRKTLGAVATPWRASGAALNTKSVKQLMADFETTIAILDPLPDDSSPSPSFRDAGMAAWDEALLLLQTDIGAIDGSPEPTWMFNIPSERYTAMLDYALAAAGIPISGGDDANTGLSGDGCWRPNTGAAFWQVVGEERGEYAPAYSNVPYFSARGNPVDGITATHEFAFQINVRCPQNLRDGDSITMVISQSSWGATYQPGDVLVLPIVAAAPRYLTGGQDGDPTQSWNVHGSVDGPLAPYAFNPDSPTAYSQPSLGFILAEGGIPFAQGDRFRFTIEGGHFRWRKDGGAWDETSPPLPIPVTSVSIDEGLSATFVGGAAASFVTGDVYRFRARQPYAISNTRTPSSGRWKWSGSTATYDADFGEVEQLDMVALLHGLPAGATVTLDGGNAAANEWSEPLTYRAGVIWKAIDRTARYVKISVASATGGSIQWPWIGEPLTTTLSGEVQISRDYRIDRPGGTLQGGRFAGKTVSGEIVWTESALNETDVDGLVAMLDHVKENNDEPIMLIPQVTRTADPVLVARINSDAIEFTDFKAYNQNEPHERRVSARLPLEGVWQ